MPGPPSIRLLVTSLAVAPLILLAAALIWLSSATSRRIAEDLGQAMVRAANDAVEDNARRFLGSAVRMGELYARRVEAGILPTDRLREWERPILDDLTTSPDVASICIGTPDGRSVYIQRAHGRLELGRGDGPGEKGCWEGVIEPDGAVRPEPLRVYQYDPRTRPWYKAGQGAVAPTWAPIYTWFGDKGSDAETSTAYVRPVHGPGGEPAGILVVDVTLSGLSEFLRGLPIAQQGRLFITDAQGLAVASSEGSVSSSALERLPLGQIESPSARAVAALGMGMVLKDTGLSAESWRVRLPEGPARATVAPFSPHPGIDWRIIAVVPESAFMGDALASQNRSLLIAGFVVLAGLAFAVAAARGLARPLVSIADHVRRVGDGDFSSRLDLRAARELVEVSSELNRMSEGLKQRMDLEKSLEVAMEVQQSLLPQGPPTAAGLDIAGSSRYCDATGGDYFDFIDVAPLPGGRTMIAVGDVMGHGIGAALLMATARAALRAHASLDADLGALLTRVNAVLARDARHGKFMTMLLLVADPSQGSFRWASAGHDPPLILDPEKGWVATEGGDLPLGVMEDVAYQEASVAGLSPGVLVVIGTDGIWEAKNPLDEDFTKDRLRAVVSANASASAAAIVGAVDRALGTFLEGRAIQDDVTMVVLRLLPVGAPVPA
jgi:sigma-B regulation protein RsbU (phosphoserine phosphatase)